jgi:hypothetical protein
MSSSESRRARRSARGEKVIPFPCSQPGAWPRVELEDLPSWASSRIVTAIVGACEPDEVLVIREGDDEDDRPSFAVYDLAALDARYPGVRPLLDEQPEGRRPGDVLILFRDRRYAIVHFDR